MSTVLYPNGAALHNIDLIRTDLVNSKLKLFKNDVAISPSTVLADLTEADFSGYLAKTVAALLPAYIDPTGGASAQIATQQFDHTGGIVANVVFGAWLETLAGVLILVVKFDQGVVMQAVGDSLPLDLKLNFGN